MSATILKTEGIAKKLGVSTRTVHEWARLGRIPHRRIGGTRSLLFVESEVEQWIVDGSELETVATPHGGRIVRPVVA